VTRRGTATHDGVAEGEVHLREAHGDKKSSGKGYEEDLEVLLVVLGKDAGRKRE
jgi:hypothetical protein